ncbi:V-type ATPase subunit [Streptomyces sp. ME18-1-4]|uniref:V-type ATPase subunit n=1 Tax=Streptomyces sp. ME18-1-4 TaxID=3028685 RepID=UPI0029BA2464|nr:V-type ATPase subunit [Streptomyces sp. ME18-1-4]MDX3242157.1 V-type ATPase subunit [Streptomyces sp. ME18-1-4]
MGAGWVAGVTRARALRTRCLGAERIRDVAASHTLEDALRYLAATPYRHDVSPGATPAEAQRAVSATLLWHLRVLAGWQPATGADAIRALAAGFEISNAQHHLRSFSADDPRPAPADTPALDTGRLPPYRLGALATAWTRLAHTRTPSELRAALAASVWGDPGDDSPAAVATGMRISAALRLATTAPDAARWAAARLALLFGREVFVVGRRLPDVSVRRAARLLGPRAVGAGSYADFRQALPATARWLLEDIDEAADMWRAEARWWEAVERDGRELLRRSHFGPQPVVGAVALLSVDAWRTRGALELAARGGGPGDWWAEVLDAPR